MRKEDPYKEEMRKLKSDSKFMFKRNEYLTGQQIASFFSRPAVKDKKIDITDLVAAEAEVK